MRFTDVADPARSSPVQAACPRCRKEDREPCAEPVKQWPSYKGRIPLTLQRRCERRTSRTRNRGFLAAPALEHRERAGQVQIRVPQDSFDPPGSLSPSGHRCRDAVPRRESCMAQTLELDGLNELRSALLEERQIILASVRKLRETRRQKGSFVLGDGSEAGPRFMAVQQQIDVIEAVIATLTGSRA